MKTGRYEDYYHWYCDWCDSENSVLCGKIQEPVYCGACHRVMQRGDENNALRGTLVSESFSCLETVSG
jgi:hypothetical protein